MIRSGAIVITGATGWIGRTLLEYLAQILSTLEFNQRVRAFGSQSGQLTLSKHVRLAVLPLTLLPEFARQEPIHSLFHAAFLTPDRASGLGLDRYCEINQAITSCICDALRFRPTARAVLFSSGAAQLAAATFPQSVDQSPLQSYGSLKLQEEIALAALVPTLVLRIYGLTGRFMREPRRYALGDFLCCAYRKEAIQIRSTRREIRGYVAAFDLSALAWKWSQSFDEAPKTPLDAVDETIDLLSLAEIIASIYHLPAVRSSIDLDLPPNVYSASSAGFLAFFNRYGHVQMSREQQIRDTYEGISALLSCQDQ